MKRRLVVTISVVAALAVIAFGVPLALVLRHNYDDEAQLALQRDTIAAVRNVEIASAATDAPELPRFRGELAIYDLRSRRIGGTGPRVADRIVARALRTGTPQRVLDGGRPVVAIPLFAGERVEGVVRGSRGAGPVAARIHAAWLRLALIAVAILAATVVAAVVLGRRLARPLESLSAVALRVGAGDVAVRAPPSAIAEIDALATALNVSSARVAELVARERQFSDNASHQLRTPLSALRLELEEALVHEPDDDAAHRALAQVERLQTTVSTLLAHARDRVDALGAVCDLGQELARAGERWHGPLAAQGRPLRLVGPASAARARIAPAVLAEILDVLVDNARTHGAGAIAITIRDAGEALAVDVGDHGPGFGAAAASAFTRGAGAGSGIGLSLARSLADAQGARLVVSRSGDRPVVSLLVRRAGLAGDAAAPGSVPVRL